LVECLPSPCVGRPLHRTLRLAVHAQSRGGTHNFVLSSMKWRPSPFLHGWPEERVPVDRPCVLRSSAWSMPFRCTERSR
jgi:hypothetical protein